MFANLIKRYPDLKLNIVGAGPERERLDEIVKTLKLEDSVSFKGQITNQEVLDLMNKSYIFILPSVAEGFGIVYAEAMKAGCITIGTKNEGIDGFIINGKNGFLVNPEEKEITKLIEEIYENKYDIEGIRKNAYKAVENLTKIFLNNEKLKQAKELEEFKQAAKLQQINMSMTRTPMTREEVMKLLDDDIIPEIRTVTTEKKKKEENE